MSAPVAPLWSSSGATSHASLAPWAFNAARVAFSPVSSSVWRCLRIPAESLFSSSFSEWNRFSNNHNYKYKSHESKLKLVTWDQSRSRSEMKWSDETQIPASVNRTVVTLNSTSPLTFAIKVPSMSVESTLLRGSLCETHQIHSSLRGNYFPHWLQEPAFCIKTRAHPWFLYFSMWPGIIFATAAANTSHVTYLLHLKANRGSNVPNCK